MERNAKGESALSSIEVTLMSLGDAGEIRVNEIALQAEKLIHWLYITREMCGFKTHVQVPTICGAATNT